MIVAAFHARDWLVRLCADYDHLAGLGIELVVVDGGSRDGSEEVLCARRNVRWLSEADDGVADAWNKALTLATGDWIVFAGADDRLGPPDAWRQTLSRLDAVAPHVSLVACSVDVISPGGAPLFRATPRPGRNLRRLKAVNAVPHQGLFTRSVAFARMGRFDGSFRVASDYEWVLRAVLGGELLEVCGDSSPVRMTFGGISTHDPLGTARELRKAQAKLGVRGLRSAWWAAWGRACIRAVVQWAVGREVAGRLADVGRRLRGLEPVWSVR